MTGWNLSALWQNWFNGCGDILKTEDEFPMPTDDNELKTFNEKD